jgi:hypothetical protein
MKNKSISKFTNFRRIAGAIATFALIFALLSGLTLPVPFSGDDKFLSEGISFVPSVEASNTYHNFSGGSLSLSLTPATVNLITTNDDWSNIASVEGYDGKNLTATHGIDPQTVLGTEFTNNTLPSGGNTQINANKGNPSAFNAGGLTEFDTGTYLAFGFQGNVQANPYMVFYLNTTGRTNVTVGYDVQDIDAGSNNSVSQIALQYRVGTTGNFTNLPSGYVADATDPNVAGRVSARSVLLPPAANNQSQVQVRLITTNSAATDGTSTPDEWIGVNNVVISVAPPTAASVSVGGQVISPYGNPLSGATVLMYDVMGGVQTARTNPFGYYRFYDVSVGEVYIFEVRSKKYVFPNAIRSIFVTENIDSLNFSAEPIGLPETKTESAPVKDNFFTRKF